MKLTLLKGRCERGTFYPVMVVGFVNRNIDDARKNECVYFLYVQNAVFFQTNNFFSVSIPLISSPISLIPMTVSINFGSLVHSTPDSKMRPSRTCARTNDFEYCSRMDLSSFEIVCWFCLYSSLCSTSCLFDVGVSDDGGASFVRSSKTRDHW